MGLNSPGNLGMSLWRRLANPIILHHSSPIHLALCAFFSPPFFFSQMAICGFPTGSPQKPECYDCKNTPWAAWESLSRPLNAICNPVTVRGDSCRPDVHTARNSLMTDTLRKHQLWLVTVKLGRGGEWREGWGVGTLGCAAFISQQLKRMMYIHANYPGRPKDPFCLNPAGRSPQTFEKLEQ